MKEYNVSAIAKINRVHPNTIRLYEKIGFLTKVPRKANGYRIYSDIHLEQVKLIRLGLKIEILQNGLRKQIIDIIKTSAEGNYNKALNLTIAYQENVIKEQEDARESIKIVENIMKNSNITLINKEYKRKELAFLLGLTVDTLRNWELNGLIKIKRKMNGYRTYNENDIKRIKIISSLRCANFSLSSILRLLNEVDKNSNIRIEKVIDNPDANDIIISACDKLITSLETARLNSIEMLKCIEKLKKLNI